MQRVEDKAGQKVWAITSYFNPAGYKRRLENYRTFRERLSVPLVAVELSFDNEFQLRPEDAEILVQLSCRDVMWQKERLLNVALEAVPNPCDTVAWLDCDVVFERRDWSDRARDLLEEFVLVQPFGRSYELSRNVLPEDADPSKVGTPRRSFAYHLVSGKITADLLRTWRIGSDHLTLRDGYAWVGRKDVLQRHGFYDARVVGGGTRDLACAALGEFDALVEGRPMTNRQVEHLLAWARPFFASVDGKIGYVEGGIFHLWHGDIENRRYTVRHSEFLEFDFDPFQDIALEDTGCWRWNTDKKEMHEHLRRYFDLRREDG